MPEPGLDTSWMMAANQAVAQHLVFGRDIVFTFGPYASVYAELYHPATDRLMISGGLFLGLSYFTLLVLLGKGRTIYWAVLYGLLLATLVNSRDALLLSYPMMLALLVERMTLPDDHSLRLHFSAPVQIVTATLFAPLAFLPLIKVSLLPICGVTFVLCGGRLWSFGKRTLTYAASALTVVSGVLFWVAAHQPALALPRFILNTQQTIAGYTEAMAYPGNPWECVLYALAAALTLLVVGSTPHRPRGSRIFLWSSYALFLFMAFKGGFVRHDQWHNVTASSSIVIAAFSLLFVAPGRRAFLPIVLAALTWGLIDPGAARNVLASVSPNFRQTFTQAWQGARKRLGDGELQKEYDHHIGEIRSRFPVDRMPGATDIYSFNQSWLLASENEWAPRPVFQSYSAYTPELAEINARHLKSANAPDKVIFRVEPIDGRLPSLEDGLSWPEIINRYSLIKLDAQSAYLQKRTAEQRSSSTRASVFDRATHEFGEEIPLPESSDPLFANIEIRPTLLGRVLGAVYKPPPLHISVRLLDGKTIQYRTVSAMMKSEFLITPLVKNTEEFALLAAGGTKYLAANQVKSFSISSDDSAGVFWNPVYTFRLQKLDLARNTEIENARLFGTRSDTAPASLSPPLILKCEGSIESVDGNSPSPKITIVRGALYINGWMGVAPSEGIVPDSAFVSLADDHGRTIYVRAHSTRREDIKQHFHQPGMPDPGYAAMIDVTDLHGLYTLGLARTYKGNLGICQQFQFPILFNP